jgi:hypothetical protein
MSKRVVLTETHFGKRIAEEETDALESYFVETEQWRKVFAGEIDVVYGPKGSGKSAIYSLLIKKANELAQREILVLPGENVMGTPVFRDLVTQQSSEEQLRGIWKLYCLSLVAQTFRARNLKNDPASRVVEALEAAGLVAADWTLKRILNSVLEYVRRLQLSGEVKIDPNTGMPELGGKITLGEPSGEERKKGFVSADDLLQAADEALALVPLKIWIVLDRLDVAFLDSDELEARALRALFRVYLDITGLRNISLKVFLRDDIWRRITEGGFREASHITRYTKITWNPQTLLNLVVRRALHNDSLKAYYHVDDREVLKSAELQQELFYRIFPKQVDSGSGKTSTLEWVLSRTKDGTKQTAPRELIHLISSAREQQLRSLEVGGSDPPGEILIDRSALKAGLPEVSSERFHQTLCAEHASLKSLLNLLEGKKTHQTAKTLAKIWNTTDADALRNAERLTEIGFFEKRTVKEKTVFWVPFVYRDALKMIQGQAK